MHFVPSKQKVAFVFVSHIDSGEDAEIVVANPWTTAHIYVCVLAVVEAQNVKCYQ